MVIWIETSRPPTYSLPLDDASGGVLQPGQGSCFREWKVPASYRDVLAGGERLAAAAWTYPSPAQPCRPAGPRSLPRRAV